MINAEKLDLWITRYEMCSVSKLSQCIYMGHTCTVGHGVGFLTALLASLPVTFVVAIAQKSLWNTAGPTDMAASRIKSQLWNECFLMVQMKLGE